MRSYTILFLVLAAVLTAGTATASPWAGTGDRQLRRDIELLSAYGVVDGPITTWPIPWSQISRGISGAILEELPNHVQNAVARVRSHIPRSRDYRGIGYEIEARGTNSPRIVRGFDGGARQNADIRLSADKHMDSTYVRLSVGFRDDPRDRDYQFDDSYIARAMGNWVGYLGTVDQWWGPGMDSALILSTNARPMPKIGIMRLDPKPFGTKWLSWLGPWQLNVFAARMSNKRDDFAHPIIAGLRLSFRPVRGLDIGLSRTLQLCGSGRPCGFKTWGNALVGFSDADNTGTPNEPGNQLAALDFRYSTYFGRTDFAVYGELMGEDEDNIVIDKFSVLVGASLGGGTESGDISWKFGAEYSDTKANRLLGKGVFRRLTYEHFIYTDGYRYRGRSIGGSLDGDSRLLTIGGSLVDKADRNYWLRYRWADISDENNPRNSASANHESINLIELGAETPTPWGSITADIRLSDDQPNTPGVSDSDASFELAWNYRF